MFRVLFLMIALLAGLIAGPYLSGQQGYVRVETANTVYGNVTHHISDSLCGHACSDLFVRVVGDPFLPFK